MQRLRPAKLAQGDTIGIISPSWYGGPALDGRVQRGLRCMERLGFRTRIASHALNNIGYVSDTAENRAADLHSMFLDPQVKAIISTLGGDHSCHLLPLLDWDLIRSHPKILLGFSDVTVLNVAIWTMTGLVTFNGPHLMTEFAEYPRIPEYSQEYVLKVLCRPDPAGNIQPSDWWTEEFLDWGTGEDLTRARQRSPSDGWTWLKPGYGEGILLGGCIESLQHLRGTRYWPDWTGAILFLETSEARPAPETVDGILMDYENMGVFDRINGLLFARPMRYSPSEKEQLGQIVLERTHKYRFPVVTDMDFGHTTPILTLPLGVRASIDTELRRFAILDAAVTEPHADLTPGPVYEPL